MRIFITSTPDELEGCRMAAVDTVRALGHDPVLRDPLVRPGLDPVPACRRQVERVDAVLAIVGFRRGSVPSADMGGDGLRPWTHFEVGSAFAARIPVAALLADETFALGREQDREAAAVMADLRGELARLGRVFDDAETFRSFAEAALRDVQRNSWSPGISPGHLRLRRFAAPELPSLPYPLLLPYAHPELMAGRDEDLADLRRTLALPVTVVGLHAASGTGKSSLLAGGLVPALRAEGRPVAFDRHPAEPGLLSRLLGDLFDSDDGHLPEVSSPHEWTDQLLLVGHLAAEKPPSERIPILIVDQFEDLLKEGAESTLAELGPVLAATAQRLPGFDGPICRWLLAYRQECHGRVVQWLGDVLREARALGLSRLESLPHDLSDSGRFADWALRPLGTPRSGSDDPMKEASRIFSEAIEKPLRHASFPWRFAPGHAERLAGAFAEARLRQPDAPLAPELQVVLAHLLDRAPEPSPGRATEIAVPEAADGLIDRALQQHLRRALDRAFPHGLDADARLARTRALLLLRELADEQGRREEGRTTGLLAEALGEQGHEVFAKLSTPRTRLVIRRRVGGSQTYGLAHDRLAEVVVRAVDEGGWAELDIDSQLLGLRRFVTLQSRLFDSADTTQATAVAESQFRAISANEEVLLWREAHRDWWQMCRERRKMGRRRQLRRRVLAAVLGISIAVGAWILADRRERYRASLDEVASGGPETAFSAIDRLSRDPGFDAEAILDRLRQRDRPFDIFESGLGGIEESRRGEALVRIAELALPILEADAENPVLIASLVWALDFFARGQDSPQRVRRLRDQALASLRQKRKPPPPPAPDDPNWVDVPAGTFWMGAGPDEGRNHPDMQNEHPRHRVSLSAFRMLTHEVTNAEYRRLVPDSEGGNDLPKANIDWYEAYTYAAWLGGRLPTESEWEYAARAGCEHFYCKRDGNEASIGEVAWWLGNSTDPRTGVTSTRPVMQLEPNPLGLGDMHGNVWEWTSNWFSHYPAEGEVDPSGPTFSSEHYRMARSGSAAEPRKWNRASARSYRQPLDRSRRVGFRVVSTELE